MKMEGQGQTREEQVFEQYSVPKALFTMAVPTIISQIIYVIYNIADTWYVGLTGDPNAVAAISLCLPVYNIMTGLSNLFGIGGASALARALGEHNRAKARQFFSIAAWSAVAAAVLYAVLLALFQRPLLLLIGGDENNIAYAVTYTTVTMIWGSLPTILAAALAHLVRATGHSTKASLGLMLGAVCNMALDPLFMFVLLPKGMELLGAAVATAISNLISLLYYVIYLWRNRTNGVYTIRLREWRQGRSAFGEIVHSGMPSFLMVATNQISNSCLNARVGLLGSSAAVGGLGIVRKIDSLAYSINQGVTQGMLPIVAYCYTAEKTERMKAVIKLSTVLTLSCSVLCSVASFLWAEPLVRFFLNEPNTIGYGASFLRILCLAVPLYSVTFVVIAVFQAVGRDRAAFVLCILHRGSIDILLQCLIAAWGGGIGIVWATPVSESIALLTALILLRKLFCQLEQKGQA